MIATAYVGVSACGGSLSAQVAVRIPDERLASAQLVEIDGTVWVLSSSALFRLKDDTATKIFEVEPRVLERFGPVHMNIARVGEAFWLFVEYPPQVGHLTRVLLIQADSATDARYFASSGVFGPTIVQPDTVYGLWQGWVVANSGVYRLDPHLPLARMAPLDGTPIRQTFPHPQALWVLTHGALYRIRGSETRRVMAAAGIRFVQEAAGAGWVITTRGVYRVVGTRVARVTTIPTVRYVIEVGGKVWLIAAGGAFRVDGDRAVRIPDRRLRPTDLLSAGGKTWVLTEHAAYRIENGTAHWFGWPPRTAESEEPFSVEDVMHVGGETWIRVARGASRGFLRVDGDSAVPLLRPDSGEGQEERRLLDVRVLEGVEGTVWLGTDDGVYRVDQGELRGVAVRTGPVNRIVPIGNDVWFAGDRGAWRVSRDSTRRVLADTLGVWNVSSTRDDIWLWTGHGAYQVRGSQVARVPNESLRVDAVDTSPRGTWVLADRGAFSVRGDTVVQVPDEAMSVTGSCAVESDSAPAAATMPGGLCHLADHTWLVTSIGVYRVDEDVRIDVHIESEDTWLSRLLPLGMAKRVWVNKVRVIAAYRATNGRDPYPSGLVRRFQVILDADREGFETAVRRAEYGSIARVFATPGTFRQTLHVRVRDQWGNSAQAEITGFVAPSLLVLPLAAALLAWTIVFGALLLAPVSEPLHRFAMSKYARGYGSFGTVPLLLTQIPVLRRHVLRRYRRAVAARDDSRGSILTRYVLPDQSLWPEVFAERLKTHRAILVLGESGVGKTAYLRYLEASWASPAARDPSAPRLPVFVALGKRPGETPEAIAKAELATYGEISDRDLAGDLLAAGGFVILIDGLNEATEEVRNGVATFVEDHKRKSLIVATSQIPYPGFESFDRVQLRGLDRPKIEDLVRRLAPTNAARIIAQLGPEALALYANPQHLELGIEVVNQGSPLPQTAQELFRAALAPIVSEWARTGHRDYADMLGARAFESLVEQRYILDPQSSSWPPDLVTSLLARQFLVRRGAQVEFRHDLVRAYLAAQYVATRIPAALAEHAGRINPNWLSMLEFLVLEASTSATVEAVLSFLVAVDPSLAGAVYKKARHVRPELVAGYGPRFEAAFAQALLR